MHNRETIEDNQRNRRIIYDCTEKRFMETMVACNLRMIKTNRYVRAVQNLFNGNQVEPTFIGFRVTHEGADPLQLMRTIVLTFIEELNIDITKYEIDKDGEIITIHLKRLER